MPAANTATAYGSVTKMFHWMTALLILTAFPLGVVAFNMPFDTSEALAAKATMFSLHKTVGIAAFAIAVARIAWALSQPRPAPMHPERRAETFLAETVHWLLYASMLIVPLSGWLHHAATEGFAPILWPLGQGLPFVPTSETVALIFKEIHFIFTKVMAASILLHVAGALKHALIDRDGTLARMWRGTDKGPSGAHVKARSPILAAFVIYLAGFGGAFALVQTHSAPVADVAALEEVSSEWQVTEGTLSITVVQLGAEVTGSFADWTAAIDFDEVATDGSHGSADVQIAIPTLTLGSVTDQALAPDFFNAAEFPTARFTANILPADEGYIAEGTLSLRGAEVPVALPFTLAIDGDTAAMSGTVTLDRRDFAMGETYPDESTVGFSVVVQVELTAVRASAAPPPAVNAVDSNWDVSDGALAITVRQLGAEITGQFADWDAAIAFEEEATDGVHGSTEVRIAIPTLTLGSVTEQALAADFFDSAQFPDAVFAAEIVTAGDGYEARGTLTLRGAEVPVTLPFALAIEGDTATMSGTVTLDRRDFGMGTNYPDESTVGFSVVVTVELTAVRVAEG